MALGTSNGDDAIAEQQPWRVDGVVMPLELSQFRELSQLRAKLRIELANNAHSLAVMARASAAPRDEEDARESASLARERISLELKASLLDDCLSEFGASLAFLHGLACEHGALLAQWAATKRREAVFPKDFQRFDESVDVRDDDADDDDDDDFLGLGGLSALRARRAVAVDARLDPGDPAAATRRPGLSAGGAADADGMPFDFEALDQRRQASLAQLRACVRSCARAVPGEAAGGSKIVVGRQQPYQPHAQGGGAGSSRLRGRFESRGLNMAARE
jgi:hypothetical protein